MLQMMLLWRYVHIGSHRLCPTLATSHSLISLPAQLSLFLIQRNDEKYNILRAILAKLKSMIVIAKILIFPRKNYTNLIKF